MERLSYDAWGKRRQPNGLDAVTAPIPATTHHGYTGHEHLDGLGLIHMNARVYDPNIGRFTSADSFMGWLELPASLNRYGYAYNNPVKHADLTGNDVYSTGHELSPASQVANGLSMLMFDFNPNLKIYHGAWLVIPNDQVWAARDGRFRMGGAEDGIATGRYYATLSAGPQFTGVDGLLLKSGTFRLTDAPDLWILYSDLLSYRLYGFLAFLYYHGS